MTKRKAANASCTATTKAGDPCPAPAMRDSVVCMMHSADPAVSQRMAIARSVGVKLAMMRGRHFKPGVKLETPQDWLSAIAGLTNDLAGQPNVPARVQVFALLSREAREWYVLGKAEEGTVIEGYTT